MKVRPDIKISTTHSYEIAYKYRWQCLDSNCSKMYVLISFVKELRLSFDTSYLLDSNDIQIL